MKEHFDEIDKDREICYKESRELRRMGVQAVRDAQRGKFDECRALVEKGRDIAQKLSERKNRFGFMEEALQEYAEAAFTLAFMLDEDPPTQEELATNERGYLTGLADTIGEMRRYLLNLLRKNELDEAMKIMDLMDELQGLLVKFDHTDAVIPLRRKQDMMRGVIERTRADLTN
ncbi:MAG: hypothetical protein KAG97_13225, partial [Victivallales bacterium]|nr:hypothetical protein [Victivallales bacterium]